MGVTCTTTRPGASTSLSCADHSTWTALHSSALLHSCLFNLTASLTFSAALLLILPYSIPHFCFTASFTLRSSSFRSSARSCKKLPKASLALPVLPSQTKPPSSCTHSTGTAQQQQKRVAITFRKVPLSHGDWARFQVYQPCKQHQPYTGRPLPALVAA